MASNKKTLGSAGFGAKRLAPELDRAEALIIKKRWAEARIVLENMSRRYPENSDVATYLVNVCCELQDLPGYERACEMLASLEPDNPHAAYALAGSRYVNLRPVLALEAFQNAVRRFPNHEKANDARKAIAELEPKVDEILASKNLTREDGWDIAALFERAQSYLAQGEYEKAKEAEKELLKLLPDFVSSYNNLSLISFAQGDLEGAIAISQKGLEVEPDNIHSLANLTRYYLLSGDIKSSEITCEKLKKSQAPGWDV